MHPSGRPSNNNLNQNTRSSSLYASKTSTYISPNLPRKSTRWKTLSAGKRKKNRFESLSEMKLCSPLRMRPNCPDYPSRINYVTRKCKRGGKVYGELLRSVSSMDKTLYTHHSGVPVAFFGVPATLLWHDSVFPF